MEIATEAIEDLKEFDETAGKRGRLGTRVLWGSEKLVVRGFQTVDGDRKANVWRRLRNEDRIAVLAEENFDVES